MFSVWSSLVSHHFYVCFRLQIWRLYDLDCDSWNWFLDENQLVKHLICSKIFSRKVSVFTHLSTSCFPQALTECVDFSVFPRPFTAAHELCCHGCAQLEFSRFHGAPESWRQSWKQAAGFQRMWQAWFEPLAPLQGLWCRLHVLSFQDWIKIGIDIKRSQTIWRRCPSSVASVRTFHSASQRLGFFRKCQEAWPTENGHGSFRMSSGFAGLPLLQKRQSAGNCRSW